MKLLAVLCVVVAVAVAAPQAPNYKYQPSEQAQLLRYENDNIGTGSYRFGFEQTDGQRVDQQGELVNEGREDEQLVVRGSFSWVAPNGVKYTITYVADDKGYQPEIEEGPGTSGAVVAGLLG